MNYRILIYGNYNPYFAFLSERLKEYGIDSDIFYSNQYSVIKKLSEKKYCAVIIFSGMNSKRTAESIVEIKKHFPESAIVAVSYNSAYRVCRTFIDAGAEKCIVMPASVNNVCQIVLKLLTGNSVYLPEIAGFVDRYNFPRHLNGFYYLCVAVELCVISPDRLSNIMSGIYEPVAERFGTGTECVERSLRHFSKNLSEYGLLDDFFRNRQNFRPSNHELICAVADAFVRHFDIYGKQNMIIKNKIYELNFWDLSRKII